jgi:Glyoxalase/Bleomycin resistance protein/Dioxygenase superfamily
MIVADMTYTLQRPPAAFDSAAGLLRVEHFQMAYITNDADAACELFSRQLGIREFARLEGPTPQGGAIRAEFAWVGTLMYEIIQASGPGTEIFSGRMPAADGFVLKHHHLGFLIPDAQQWDGVLANARRNGWNVPHEGVNPLVRVCFVEVPGLPHYCEYLYPTKLGLDFFNGVPRT